MGMGWRFDVMIWVLGFGEICMNISMAFRIGGRVSGMGICYGHEPDMMCMWSSQSLAWACIWKRWWWLSSSLIWLFVISGFDDCHYYSKSHSVSWPSMSSKPPYFSSIFPHRFTSRLCLSYLGSLSLLRIDLLAILVESYSWWWSGGQMSVWNPRNM